MNHTMNEVRNTFISFSNQSVHSLISIHMMSVALTKKKEKKCMCKENQNAASNLQNVCEEMLPLTQKAIGTTSY